MKSTVSVRRPALRASIRPALASALVLALTACSGGVLDARGPIAASDRQMMLNALAIMLAIVVPTIAAALAFAWWFRDSNPRAGRHPHFVFSGAIEIVVWSIPLLVITFLGGIIWTGSHELDPYRPIASQRHPVEVQVISLDWKWLFIYPERGVASVNQLVLPTGVPVHFSLTSGSVMNAFWVPQLGSMIATMNGMVTQLYLQADVAGDYYGRSAQFSGDGFSDMKFTVRAVAEPDFERWLDHARATGRALDRAAYATLARESRNVSPSTYRAVDATVFQAVASREIAPENGPQEGRGGVKVHPESPH